MNGLARNAVSALLILSALLVFPGIASADPPGSGWRVVFEDDFSRVESSIQKWDTQRYDYWLTGYPKGTAAPVTYNNMESTPYATDRNSMSNGQLHQMVYRGRTGTVNTLRTFNFTYGYVEARIKVPNCVGCWPALWMLGSTPAPAQQAWPPEIDIFEFFPNIPGGHPLFDSHWRNSSGTVVNLDSISPGGHRPATTSMANFTGAFHTYGFHWSPYFIQGYIDGVPGIRYSGSMVPHAPMYLIETLQSAKGYTTPDGSVMSTDWVRVFQ